MKRFYSFGLIVCLVLSGELTLGQSMSSVQVQEVQKSMNKINQPAYMMELPFAPEEVEKALQAYIGKASSSSGKNRRGTISFMGVSIPELSTEKTDVYAIVERKSRREKNRSVVYLFVSKGYDNFVSSASDRVLSTNAQQFLSNFASAASQYSFEQSVKKQQDLVSKQEAARKKLETKVAKTEKELEKLRKQLAEQSGKLEKEKILLQSMQLKN